MGRVSPPLEAVSGGAAGPYDDLDAHAGGGPRLQHYYYSRRARSLEIRSEHCGQNGAMILDTENEKLVILY